MDRPQESEADIRQCQEFIRRFLCPVTTSVAVSIICTIIGLFSYIVITASFDGANTGKDLVCFSSSKRRGTPK